MNTIEAALEGKLGGDPELRTAKSGKTYVRFNVAVGEGDATNRCRSAFDTMAHAIEGRERSGWISKSR